MANPYIQVHRRIARHTGFSWRPWVPVLAAVVALPWIAPSLLGFLPSPGDAVEPKLWVPALSNLVSRLANLIAAMVILHSYTDLVRGSDRDVLDVHPVRATALVRAIALRTARTRIYLPVMGGVVLTPVAMGGHMMAYWGAVGVLFAAWLGGLGVGFMVHLGGVWAAFSPRFAALLDAVRGDNPRMQAALIYAPGVALLVVGLGVEFAAIGLELALTGWSVGWAWWPSRQRRVPPPSRRWVHSLSGSTCVRVCCSRRLTAHGGRPRQQSWPSLFTLSGWVGEMPRPSARFVRAGAAFASTRPVGGWPECSSHSLGGRPPTVWSSGEDWPWSGRPRWRRSWLLTTLAGSIRRWEYGPGV